MERKEKKRKRPYLGRIPLPAPGGEHQDKKKYSRKKKHKNKDE